MSWIGHIRIGPAKKNLFIFDIIFWYLKGHADLDIGQPLKSCSLQPHTLLESNLVMIQNLKLRISTGYDKLTITSWVRLICRYVHM